MLTHLVSIIDRQTDITVTYIIQFCAVHYMTIATIVTYNLTIYVRPENQTREKYKTM